MMTTSSDRERDIFYPQQTMKRAERALCCSPFRLELFEAMCQQSVNLPTIASPRAIELNYATKILTENQAEDELTWLIEVGLLRREVDGQGLTDSFRLTPLGRQIITSWKKLGDSFPKPSITDQFYNTLNRRLRLSF